MKGQIKISLLLPIFLGLFMGVSLCEDLQAQNTKKHRIRLRADYVKIMDSMSYLDIKASARIDKKNVTIPDIDLRIYNVLDDENTELGSATTDRNGESRFVIEDIKNIPSDSNQVYNLLVAFDGNDLYRRAKRNLSFRNADIRARAFTKDSINYIGAELIDAAIDSTIAGESLDVQVERLFLSLPIGEEFNYTDENGTIIVPVEAGIPGVNGILNVEVMLNDSDDYGTVKALVKAPFGTPIVDESTFDKRTMWSARDKTPWFLLIFPNLLILGMWGLIGYLFINLYRIAKS
jgi:hypothetical protein